MGRTFQFHCTACNIEYRGSIGRDRGIEPDSELKTIYCRRCERPRMVEPAAKTCPECSGEDVFEWPARDDQPVEPWMPGSTPRPHVRCPRCDAPVPIRLTALWD